MLNKINKLALAGIIALAGCSVTARAQTPTPTPSLEEITISLAGLPVDASPLEMVKIPAGSFSMGSVDSWARPNEVPIHDVTIENDFYIGKYEVTQAQWELLMGNNPSSGYGVGDNLPVYSVSWNDIRDSIGFLSKINALGHGVFRLPSETEWEYACRAGTTTRFYFGDESDYSDLDNDNCIFNSNMDPYMWWCGNDTGSVEPVGQKLPNPWGLYDMHGSLWEWCEDDWHYTYSGAPSNEAAWIDSPRISEKSVRSGLWSSVAGTNRSARRDFYDADMRHMAFGFRLAMDVPNLEEIIIEIAGLPTDASPLKMVRIPSGSFVMGSTDPWARPKDIPVHDVTIENDFYIGKYEITQAQWETLMGNNPSGGYGVGNNIPVYFVTWNDIRDSAGFLSQINSLGKGNFRLPTEAEWEYACRAGTTTRFSFGDPPESYTDSDNHNCVFDPTMDKYMWWCGNDTGKVEPVGQKLPNPWGLHDMHGNLWEWCSDWFGTYPSDPQIDPTGPSSGSLKALRSGRWDNYAGDCRSAMRGLAVVNSVSQLFGFRIVMDPDTHVTPTPTPGTPVRRWKDY